MRLDNENKIFSGELCISPELGLIESDDQSVRLGPVNMKVLLVLIDSAGKVVSRNSLFEQVWPNQLVSDDTLTRCISDLRGQLKSLSPQEKLIETVPKRGYRWLLPAASGQPKPETQELNVIDNNKQDKSKDVYSWLIGASIAVLIIVGIIIASSYYLSQPRMVRLALLPIESGSQNLNSQAQKIAEVLRKKLLETESIRFLSTSAIKSRPSSPFPYFAREFGTQWIIEGKIELINKEPYISLSLVDARTALVTYNLKESVNQQTIQSICQRFISDIEEIAK